ncbi:glycosyltransferase family 4 protein [Arsenicicoccus sp. oral taxon 190]|uniref:glycosyltransferase family 4 protein n=1 Tax=Arsenicicoccus sp. oral taxon 190 TaxID=1658671 RepID=UPI00067A3537|nr:glycosyltransferase family 1 protein [Arsenicicoccus sp. oral taxon 190]AKT52440.1 glycosyl transferase [Arsenicicoccus sp. oral taxon 190]
MRIAIVTESFLPSLNGVTTSVCRVLDRLRETGHDAMVIAPAPAPQTYAGFPVRAVTSIPVRQFQVGLPTGEIEALLRGFAPDVVHVASPFVLGARGLTAASRLGLPCVAIYQTDMPSYLEQHGNVAGAATGRAAAKAAWRWIRRIHSLADLTLAPSSAALRDIEAHGVPRTGLWGRGVDTSLFRPEWRDDAGSRALRSALAPDGQVLLGYVGRLAPEKEVERLVSCAQIPGTRFVIVGDGPSRAPLAETLSEAVASSPGRPNLPPVFLGRRSGDDLARAYAAFDVFVHTGTRETFGQTLQEAAATRLPVVAPAMGGPLDLVDHGTTGLLFDPASATDLADCVRRLAQSPAERAAMGTAGLARVSTRSWAALVDQLVAHYESAIARHDASAA